MIGPENSRHSLNQSDVKLYTTWSPAFSRAFGIWLVFTLSSHWLFSFLLIGRCGYFGFARTILKRKLNWPILSLTFNYLSLFLGFTFTQIRDAVALCEYFCWLEKEVRVSSAGLVFS